MNTFPESVTMQEHGESFEEYEQRKISEMRDTTAQRQQRKALRASQGLCRERIPALILSPEGDALLFDGQAYNLFYAHGNLKVEPAFAAYLRKKGYSSTARKEIHERVSSHP